MTVAVSSILVAFAIIGLCGAQVPQAAPNMPAKDPGLTDNSYPTSHFNPGATNSVARPAEPWTTESLIPNGALDFELDFAELPLNLGLVQDETNGGAEQGIAQNEANNPLTRKYTFNIHNYYVPGLIGLDDDRQANQALIRGLVPHSIGGIDQLFRFTLPIATNPTFPDGYDTGLGDLTLINYFPFKTDWLGGLEVAVGPVLVIPTAHRDSLGSGKWQAGASGSVISSHKWGLVGGLVTYQTSFAGDDDRDDVSLLTFQPLALCNLPDGWYLRSTAIWNFDLEHDTYYIPVGAGIGKVWQVGGAGTTINAFIEPQYTVFHDGEGMPRWQIFAGINFQFTF